MGASASTDAVFEVQDAVAEAKLAEANLADPEPE
jgi:hypothetical protein